MKNTTAILMLALQLLALDLCAQTWYKRISYGSLFPQQEIGRSDSGYVILENRRLLEISPEGQTVGYVRSNDLYTFARLLRLPNGDVRIAYFRIDSLNRYVFESINTDGSKHKSNRIAAPFAGMVAANVNDSIFVAMDKIRVFKFLLDYKGNWTDISQNNHSLFQNIKFLAPAPEGYIVTTNDNSIARIDTSGNTVWQTPVGTFSVVYCMALSVQGVIVAHSSANGRQISLLDRNTGSIIWSQKINLLVPYSIADIPGGGYIIGGKSNGSKACLLKTNANGNQVFLKEYLEGYTSSVVADPDGSFVFIAHGSGQYHLLYAVRTDADGNTAPVTKLITTEKHLETGGFRATLAPVANLTLDGYSHALEIPKDSLTTTFYGIAPWIAGLSPAKILHSAVMDYKTPEQSPYQPGVIGGVASDFDQVWRVSQQEIAKLRSDFEEDGKIDAPVPSDIMTWPAKNNPNYLKNGSYLQVKTPRELFPAPYVDRNNDQKYNVFDGDYPAIKGDQMAWWVMNDNNTLNRKPLEIDIAFSAYSYDCPKDNAVSNALFLDYQIIHRGTISYDSTYLGQWSDPDIGCGSDDYIGSMPDIHTAFAYNTDPEDGVSGTTCTGYNTFKSRIPIQSITWLNQPMQRTLYYNNGSSAGPSPIPGTTDPSTPLEMYRILKGFWAGGTPFTVGGSGYGSSGTPAAHVFPDNPANPAGWSMCSAGLATADRRIVTSKGPFVFAPGDTLLLQTALLYHPDIPLPCPDVDPVRLTIQEVRQWHQNGYLQARTNLPYFVTIQPGSTASLEATLPGATAYNWSNGETANRITVATPGQYTVTISRAFGCDLVETTVVRAPLSAAYLGAEISWSIAPNPVANTAQIICQECTGLLEGNLYNAQGVWLSRAAGYQHTLQFDLNTLPSGVYWVQLRQKGMLVGSKKILKF